MGELSFKLTDLYGHKFGYESTRSLVTPEAEDQLALVDSEDLAKKVTPNADPSFPRNILIGFFILTMAMIFFSMGGI